MNTLLRWIRNRFSPEITSAASAVSEALSEDLGLGRRQIFRKDRRAARARLLAYRARPRGNWKSANTVFSRFTSRDGGHYAFQYTGALRRLDPKPYTGKSGRREELACRRAERLAGLAVA